MLSDSMVDAAPSNVVALALRANPTDTLLSEQEKMRKGLILDTGMAKFATTLYSVAVVPPASLRVL
jgi:hypothetical protein